MTALKRRLCVRKHYIAIGRSKMCKMIDCEYSVSLQKGSRSRSCTLDNHNARTQQQFPSSTVPSELGRHMSTLDSSCPWSEYIEHSTTSHIPISSILQLGQHPHNPLSTTSHKAQDLSHLSYISTHRYIVTCREISA